MDRVEYLKMCQQVSMYNDHSVPKNLVVTFQGGDYIPRMYEMWFNKGKTMNTGIIEDVKSGSFVHADLKNIEVKEVK